MKIKRILMLSMGAILVLSGCGSNASLDPTSDSSSTSSPTTSESSATTTTEETTSPTADPTIPTTVEEPITGTGTKESPYVVTMANHLLELASLQDIEKAIYVSLENDVDLKGIERNPLGSSTSMFQIAFNGNNHKISGLSITKLKEDKINAVGLFAFASGYIRNLVVEGNINVTAKDATAVSAGLIAGYTDNLMLLDCVATGEVKVNNDGVQDVSSQTYAGGLVGAFTSSGSYFIEATGNTSKVHVESLGDIGIAGGLAASVESSLMDLGISTLNSNYVDTDIVKGSVFSGGLVGKTYYYVSAVNNVVKATEVSTTSSFYNSSFSGGLAGSSYSETAFLFNVVNVGSIKAAETTSKGYVGRILGVETEDGYAYNEDSLGSVSYENVAIGGELVGSNKNANEESAVELNTLKAEEMAKIGLDKAFILKDGVLPEIKENASSNLYGEGNFNIHKNFGASTDVEAVPAKLSMFNSNVDTTFKVDKHMLTYMSYDPVEVKSYRWYAPINFEIDLYDQWYDLSSFVGYYGGADSYNPVFYFDYDGSVITLQNDYASYKGTYWTNGYYVVFTVGNFDHHVAVLENGKYVFPDISADEYSYSYTHLASDFGYYKDNNDHRIHFDGKGNVLYTDGYSKIETTYTINASKNIVFTIPGYEPSEVLVQANGDIKFTLDDYDYPFTLTLTPYDGIDDYSKEPFIGRYGTNKDFDIDFLADGNTTYHRPGKDTDFAYGGFRAFGTTVEIKNLSQSELNGTYKYDKTEDVMVSSDGEKIIAKGQYVQGYATASKDIRIHLFKNDGIYGVYLIVNNKLDTKTTMTGYLTDGKIVKVGTKEYKVEGSLLTYVDPEADVTPLVGVYEGTIGETAVEAEFKLDRTVTIGTETVAFKYDGSKITFELAAGSVELTFDATNKAFAGTCTKDGTAVAVVLKEKVEAPVVKSLVGSWQGKTGYGITWKLDITADNKVVLTLPAAAIDGTWSGDISTGKISFVAGGYSGTVSLYSTDQDKLKMSATDDDYNDFIFDMTRI